MSGIEITGGSYSIGSFLIGIGFLDTGFNLRSLLSIGFFFFEGLMSCFAFFLDTFLVFSVDSMTGFDSRPELDSSNSSVGDTDTSLISSSNGELIIISFGAKISSIDEPTGLLNICETLLGLRTTPSGSISSLKEKIIIVKRIFILTSIIKVIYFETGSRCLPTLLEVKISVASSS